MSGELLAVFDKPDAPDRWRFVWNEINDLGLHAVLAMTEDGRHAAWVHAQYDPEGENPHLGERTTLQALATERPRTFDAFIGWAAINTEYGRDENGQIIREEE